MKTSIILFALSMLCKISDAQLKFGDMIICHDKKYYLSCISNDEYLFHFKNGLFSGFETTDGIVKFSEASKTFTLKNVRPRKINDSIVVLQLTNDGPVLKNSDSTVLLTTAGDVYGAKPEAAIVDFFNFFVYLEYSGGKLYKVSFDAGVRKIGLNIFEYEGGHYWDINSISKTNALVLDYTFSKLQLITLRVSNKKAGVNLYTKKGKDFFYLLELYEIEATGLPKPKSKILYNRSGIANAKKTTFKTEVCKCE
jgi:hypothetical protein